MREEAVDEVGGREKWSVEERNGEKGTYNYVHMPEMNGPREVETS